MKKMYAVFCTPPPSQFNDSPVPVAREQYDNLEDAAKQFNVYLQAKGGQSEFSFYEPNYVQEIYVM